MVKLKRLAIFCGSSIGADSVCAETARELAAMFADYRPSTESKWITSTTQT